VDLNNSFLFNVATWCQFHQRSSRSFYRSRSRKQKKYSQAFGLFALLGSAHAKAASRTLMKLTTDYKVTISLEYQITQLSLLWNNCGYILFTCCRFWWCKSAFSRHKTYHFCVLIILPLLCTQNFQFLLLRVLSF